MTSITTDISCHLLKLHLHKTKIKAMITQIRHEIYNDDCASISIHIDEVEGARLQKFIRFYNVRKTECNFYKHIQEYLIQMTGNADEISKAYREITAEFVQVIEIPASNLVTSYHGAKAVMVDGKKLRLGFDEIKVGDTVYNPLSNIIHIITAEDDLEYVNESYYKIMNIDQLKIDLG